MELVWLDPDDVNANFPDLDEALEEPNGLLAAGGCLSPQRLLKAYSLGIFPWYEDGQPILWWSPAPRMVVEPHAVYHSKSLKKIIRQQKYHCTFDQNFTAVVAACSEKRTGQSGTWITHEMKQAYGVLHDLGHAHSVEVWDQEQLVGGLYGVAIGQCFFGESMFSRKDNASKVGFSFLAKWLSQWGYQLIDCQVYTDHLSSLGASEISREVFKQHLRELCRQSPTDEAWQC